jgi:hypothetical protein
VVDVFQAEFEHLCSKGLQGADQKELKADYEKIQAVRLAI